VFRARSSETVSSHRRPECSKTDGRGEKGGLKSGALQRHLRRWGEIELDRVTFRGNEAVNRGGGMHTSTKTTIRDCLFDKNCA